MLDWRDKIVEEIKNKDGIILAIDPNSIVSFDDVLLKKINYFEFETIPFSDSISLRYFIENKILESSSVTKVLIIYNNDSNHAESEIPYDILQTCYNNGNIIYVNVEEIFPHLSSNIVEKLNSKFFDQLFNACNAIHEKKNEKETKEFILEKIFNISSKTFSNTPSSLILNLLNLHFKGNELPKVLSNYLIDITQKNQIFAAWPIGKIIKDKQDFFEFLQKEWENTVHNKRIENVPFDDEMISNHLDNLFFEGYLTQIDSQVEGLPEWMKIGIKNYDKKIQILQYNEHAKMVEKEIGRLENESNFADWQKFSLNWANLCNKEYLLNENSVKKISEQIDDKFSKWVENKYRLLRNLASELPIMVHQIFDYLIKQRQKSNSKIALVVLDGMSLAQWFLIKEKMGQIKPKIKEKTNTCFAWIPTVTSISRQSIFAGLEPYYFKDFLLTTKKEEVHWKIKWSNDTNVRKDDIFYKTNTKVWNHIDYEDIPIDSNQILGIVINTIDEKMHSASGGTKDLLGQIQDWTINSKFFDFIEKLIKSGFEVYLTSDHGNIEAKGIGEPKGDFSQERGRRVRIYSNEESLNNASKKINESKIWWPNMAGSEHHFLLALDKKAFSKENELVVTHGGTSIEEVIVPFVKLWEEK